MTEFTLAVDAVSGHGMTLLFNKFYCFFDDKYAWNFFFSSFG